MYSQGSVSVNTDSQADLVRHSKGFSSGPRLRPNTCENTVGQGLSSDTTISRVLVAGSKQITTVDCNRPIVKAAWMLTTVVTRLTILYSIVV